MEESKQTRGAITSWTLIGVAFIAIIVFLLAKFVTDGKKTVTTQTQDKLINYATAWAVQVDSEMKSTQENALIFADLIGRENYSVGDVDCRAFAKTLVEDADVSHVIFCTGDKVISDENSEKAIDINLSMYAQGTGEAFNVVSGIPGYDENASLISYAPIGDEGDYILLVTHLSDISTRFVISAYEDVSFLSIVTKDGKIIGNFDKYKDTDSMYIASGNLISAISQGIATKDAYNTFKVKLYNGMGCAAEATYQNDARTICFSHLTQADWYLAYGVRQFYVDKVISTNFSTIKSTVIKLGIVVAVFGIFAVSTFLFNSVKSKEIGRVLEDKADTDLLTELNNKAATERKIQEYLDNNPNGRALMFILDIDNFKKINDTMGHAFGDTLLKTLGKEIKTEFRMTDIIGRTGGDEFMVFLKDVTDDLIVEREANRITRFFHDFKAGGDYVKYSASASIGAAIYPDDAKTFKDLYVAADQALYKAKRRGKNQLVFYNETARQ